MLIYQKDRRAPVRLFDDFSELKGLTPGTSFHFQVCRDEYYVVQLLLCECSGPYTVVPRGLDGRVTIYNTQGIDKFGRPFAKPYETQSGRINPLYIGVDFSGLAASSYSVSICLEGVEQAKVSLTFQVTRQRVANHGYDDLWRLSRLNWLNSTRAQDDEVTPPFLPIRTDGQTLELLGRTVRLGAGVQLMQMESYFDEGVNLMDTVQRVLLSEAVTFSAKGQTISYRPPSVENQGAWAVLAAEGQSEALRVHTRLIARCEGNLEYFTELSATADCETEISLCVPFHAEAAVYNCGLGKRGGRFAEVSAIWGDQRHDSMYIGTVNAGVMIRLKAEDYRTPLVNVYYHNLPIVRPIETWENHGLGTMKAHRAVNGAVFEARTGRFLLKKGERRVFRYEFFLTPYKPIDYQKHFAVRYYHSNAMKGNEDRHLKKAEQHGLNYMNIHHGNDLHPYINYPFIETERMKRFVQAAAQKGIGVKVYYTAREMSNHTAEVFCYKAFGKEIILQQKGQGLDTFHDREWLHRYFGENVIPAWQVHYRSGPHKGDDDIAFIIQPDSRIENYYIEGLQWLVDQIGIKGIYIDDTSLDAVTLRRARKVLDQVGGLIDMHMWNHEEARAGDAACVNIYADILPFLDTLWIGEGFDCRKLPADYILTEVSGLPYGNTSQMLEGGGNPYVGMLYAMNNRYGWGVYNADRIYRIWDAFGIQQAQMLGYWHSKCPIRTDHPEVLVTVYQKPDALLAVAYNFSEKAQSFHYEIDLERLPFRPGRKEPVRLYAKEWRKIKRATNLGGENILPKRDGVMFLLHKA